MYRFLIKKKATEKNEVTRNLFICILEKFNGYEIIRNNLCRKERIYFIPINMFYESNYDENTPVVSSFTDKIHWAYKSYVERLDKRKERISNRIVKQCHYCQNFFSKMTNL